VNENQEAEMIPAEFEYTAVKSLDEALRLLDRHGDEAKVLAGGHSLLPLMKLRLASPRYVIDIGRLHGLSYIRLEGEQIAIGGLTTHADIVASDLLHGRCAVLAETASSIGDVQVRNRGTIGGSLAHADPAADYPATILALDAEIVATSGSGKRAIPAAEFFVDLLATQLHPGEILTEVRVPASRPGTGAAYEKLHQPASGFALVGVAARIAVSKGSKIEDIAVGVTGLGAKAFRATSVEKALRGKIASPKLFADAVRQVAQGIDALSDIHASADYRKEMAAVYARRALEKAFSRATGGSPRKPNGKG
jgi:carbon-monoxide dehydrogenase medium subunit